MIMPTMKDSGGKPAKVVSTQMMMVGNECGAEVPAFIIFFGVQLLLLKYIFIQLITNIVHKNNHG